MKAVIEELIADFERYRIPQVTRCQVTSSAATEKVELEGHDVAIVPAWRWLLESA